MACKAGLFKGAKCQTFGEYVIRHRFDKTFIEQGQLQEMFYYARSIKTPFKSH